MLSNPTTTLDSVTSYKDYVNKAKECEMKAIAFTEHGNILSWYNKKKYCEENGLKYIHGAEVYVTKDLKEKRRDNYHVILLSKNLEGFYELNELVSKSFNRANVKIIDDIERFYFNPRITYDELKNTSDNIIILSGCLGGILNSGDAELEQDFIQFMAKNKHRCFLEIQHHHVEEQRIYNQKLYKISQNTGIELVAGTDTHSLDVKSAKGREILQKAKNVRFENEENWDLIFKTYDELVDLYEKQNALPRQVYLKAVENTNKIADMIEEYEIDTSFKYPKIYKNSEQVFYNKIMDRLKKHPYVLKRYKYDDIKKRIDEEFEVYKKTNLIDFMLLQSYLRDWERDNGIYCGYSRGSISGSMIAYILGITEMDSIKFGLNFFRFANPERVSLADIDTDYSEEDREKVKKFILKDKMSLPNLYTSEVITFNTIALKGAIRDVGRALEIPLSTINDICKRVDFEEDKLRKQYEELFTYADILQGTIVSIGTHPAGCVITDKNIHKEFGTITLPTTEYPVTAIDMKELESLGYLKLDILGLKNIGVINETCKLAGIERKTPDNTDLNDMNVWKSIREDTTGIFQWESESAQAYLKEFMSDETLNKVKSKIKNFNMIKWFSFGNGLIRPGCASFRDNVAQGNFYDNGLKELNEFLSSTLGHVTMQEDIMMFLNKFCGYTMGESDNVRRAIAKKKGTEKLIPEIKERFINYTSKHYNVSKEKCEKIIEPFLQVILDASDYAFSWNHSDSYSCIGYICGWLRYYYPLEFLTASLNIFEDEKDKTKKLVEYANKIGIQIKPARFRYSASKYMFDKATNTIYKGVASIKNLNYEVAEQLYSLRGNKYNNFYELMLDIKNKVNIRSDQLDILIKLDYFQEFGKAKKLLTFVKYFNQLYKAKVVVKGKFNKQVENIIKKYSKETKSQYRDLDNEKILLEIWSKIPNEDLSVNEKIMAEKEYLGYVSYTNPKLDKRYILVMDLDIRYSPRFTAYCLNNGKTEELKVYKQPKGKKMEGIVYYKDIPFEEGDILYCKQFKCKPRSRKTEKGWEDIPGTKEWWLINYTKV